MHITDSDGNELMLLTKTTKFITFYERIIDSVDAWRANRGGAHAEALALFGIAQATS